MPFSHHSHSGQFCGHATNTLEEVIQTAISKKIEVFAMTEHMPRDERDFYPEEIKTHTTATLSKLFDDYYHEALRLQKTYTAQIKLLVGMEIDWIRPESKEEIDGLLSKYQFDLFIGSIHHVHAIPIDYDNKLYFEAREKSGGTDERLSGDYFDLQYEMLQALKPPIVGHFDLVRLLSDDPNVDCRKWSGVWEKVVRNLKFVAEYGGVLELNTAALRKGMEEVYPKMETCKAFLAMGGTFTVSDDSHGVGHVATNYEKLPQFFEKAGIDTIVYFEKTSTSSTTMDNRFPNVYVRTSNVAKLREHSVFK